MKKILFFTLSLFLWGEILWGMHHKITALNGKIFAFVSREKCEKAKNIFNCFKKYMLRKGNDAALKKFQKDYLARLCNNKIKNVKQEYEAFNAFWSDDTLLSIKNNYGFDDIEFWFKVHVRIEELVLSKKLLPHREIVFVNSIVADFLNGIILQSSKKTLQFILSNHALYGIFLSSKVDGAREPIRQGMWNKALGNIEKYQKEYLSYKEEFEKVKKFLNRIIHIRNYVQKNRRRRSKKDFLTRIDYLMSNV